MNIKARSLFTVSFLLFLFSQQLACMAQSTFNKDSLLVNDRFIYILPSKHSYNISTDKAFLHSPQQYNIQSNDIGFINGDVINSREFAREYIKAISRERTMLLARNWNMTLILLFNHSGNVDAVKFIIPEKTNISPEDLVTIDKVIKTSIHIKLPESLKHFNTLAPYSYTFDFLTMASYKTEDPEDEPLHTDWVNNDIDLLKQVSGLDKSNPQNVADFFARITNSPPRSDTLGFGWIHERTGKGAGYISVDLDYYTHNGIIASYSLSSQISYRKDMAKKYDSLLHVSMPIDSGRSVYYKFREDRILAPLTYIAKNKYKRPISLQMLKYMSPLSGTMYGYYGGLPIGMLQNREMFNEISKWLSPEQIVVLMYSINPASRLTAIEYYYRHPELFSHHKAIKNWIKSVYTQKSRMESINGCLVYEDKPENLVNSYLKWQPPLEN